MRGVNSAFGEMKVIEPCNRWPASVTSVTVRLNQLQAGDAFLDPVPVEFTVSGKKVRRTIVPTGKSTEVTIQLPANPSAVIIDPDDTLLKEIINE